ncbi:(Lyso)-N-acylphosphatidylethanolamine lipase [Microcaecilia unicolor]|uniref:(Lyso)-N-acylphosphatidylethanolamine lipase n=1 Tax=Microcaecilia unicolor TaxID=1415580 RepID=A0A6P7WKC7_9AMPH|nr:(Lyso)-N-acylphosphatidylethanolamine lipase-like [Microcaecilia unicolor]XP_030043782.1 (Lyso)-N-acylphosphatidylethanolamine lipase-like [Microcaecilia unicolor]
MPGISEAEAGRLEAAMAEDLAEQQQNWLTGWIPSWCPTSMSQLKAVETRILQCIKNKFSTRYVSLLNQNKIWTLTVSPEYKDRTPLVMLHGFGGGLGLWIQNVDYLSSWRTLHAMDLLGFGRSSRPTFPHDPEGAEEEFVNSIESWREEMGIQNMILLGHSMGGFLATSYSIKYPDRVKHLILVDPWGFPQMPTDPNDIRRPPTWVKAVVAIFGRSNPLAVLRVAGPWGPGLVQRFRPDFKRKFADLFEDDTISEYIYHCNAQTPSGESAFKTMMERFGWAKRPMMSRIHLIPRDLPITFVYGAESWIDLSTGEKAKRERPGSYVKTVAIEGASHHVYADQPHPFNVVVRDICDDVD